MQLSLLSAILLPGVLFLFSYLLPLYRNFQQCRKSGFRIEVVPVDSHNPLYMALGGLTIKPLSRWLPRSIWRRVRYTMHGWSAIDQARGVPGPDSTFIMVGPTHNELWVEDPEIVEQILKRTTEFRQAPVTKRLLGIFGPNVIVLDGQDWQRHRRIVTAALGERISPLVWQESSRQAAAMMQNFASLLGGRTDKTLLGLRRIAINVLSRSGYGVASAWNVEDRGRNEESRMPYADVLDALTQGFILIAMLPMNLLQAHFMPRALRRIGQAAAEFPIYTRELLESERSSWLQDEDKVSRRSFISSLVRYSRDQEDTDSKKATQLSDQELQGNLFQFTLAGFDTTANTLAYAITLLAVYPNVQNWIVEELGRVIPRDGAPSYETTFPRLIRCLALMYETLRLYTPVANVGRLTQTEQIIKTSFGTFTVPAKTHVLLDFATIHTKKSIWGTDASSFRPTRWIADNSDTATFPKAFIDIPRASFLPWSSGARTCPGMKMAQVEFVAVFGTIFRDYTVEPALLSGETKEVAVHRTIGVLKDSLPRLTLQMNRPEDVKLIWKRRA